MLYILFFQNIALKQEAKRVEEIMNNKAMDLVRKTQLEGQRKLDEALVEARKRFDREKEDAIKETVRKLQKEFDGRLKAEQQENKKEIEKLNQEWNDKITVCLPFLFTDLFTDFLFSEIYVGVQKLMTS